MRARRLVFSVLTLGALAGTAVPAVMAGVTAGPTVVAAAGPAVYAHA